MTKKHFIILGRVGLVYFSWVFVVLFLSLIIAYEGTHITNWPAIILGLVFIILLIYTFLTSYWNEQYFKLPFRAKVKSNKQPEMFWQWRRLNVYVITVADLEKYYLLRIAKD
ncbi:acyltransferase [Lactobacillus sp. ESL0731]|uniref:acyltransferase n=1 Tax=unclassified Lactobacillus TaxID=2620435 RepID=UPI0023F8E31B|nr:MULTISPECIES: acyltransferase [unclassified Lactobacillus]WEV50277.1 acyltransferase [Lactobacillus sp. ESL0700]WEV61406.1 acyltransferase [Lactobacillus sp. ESL0731]